MDKLDISKLIKSKNRITIDIVGDSVTWGLNHCSEDETYAAYFAKMLAEKFSTVSVYRYDGITNDEFGTMEKFSEPIQVSNGNCEKRIDVIKNGIGGNTVRRAINRIDDFTGVLANGELADITIFMFGINDALKSDEKKYVKPEKFYDDYGELLNRFEKSEGSQVIIMSPTTNDQKIDEYVKMAERIASEKNILYIDQNKMWNEHFDARKPNFGQDDWLSDVSWDACHPTPKGARAIAEKMMMYVV